MIYNKINTWALRKQSCPISEDLESEELKKLAKRLKGDSENETLTNILEWQDRNIQYWWEKRLLESFLLTFLLTLIIVIVVFLLCRFFNIVTKVFYHPSLLYFWCLGAIALIMVSLILIYLFIRYMMFWRGKKTVKENISKLTKVIFDTFRLDLPVDKILEYKLAICRDYAKLTASLLFKIYPDSKLYFIAMLGHVAVAVKIRDNYYVLDKHLPILRIDKWLIGRNKKKADVYVSEVLRNSTEEPIKVTFSKHRPITRKPKPYLPKINTEKLTEEIAKILGIKQSSQKNEPDFEIPLPNYAIYYDDDDITKYSLIKAIKNKLESELCSNSDKVSKIGIIQNEKDLILDFYLNNVEMNTEFECKQTMICMELEGTLWKP